MRDEAISFLRDTGDRQTLVIQLGNQGGALAFFGQFDQALTLLGEGYQIGGEIGLQWGQAFNLMNTIETKLGMEDFEGALQRIEEYRRMAEITQSRSAGTEILMYLAVAHSARGRKDDLEQSMRYVQKAIRFARKEPFVHGECPLWNIRAQIAQKMGRSEKALKYSQQAIDLFRKQPHEEEVEVDLQFTRYQVLKDLGRLQEAEDALSAALSILKKLEKNIESEEFRRSFWEVPLRRRIAEAAREVGLESSQK